ncbi:MAG: hypothetical protein NTW45_09200 [Rhodocyclales bacterium]|nr:hypothetical protein [Rhodocyclales bacterium]
MSQPTQKDRSASLPESGFALLRVDQASLVVPRDDIRILELTIDVDRNEPPSRGVGWIAFGPQRCPVYCPSQELGWMDAVAENRPVCAVVASEQRIFGLLCSEAGLIANDEIVFQELPPAMATPGSPIRRLATYQGALACVSSAADLLADILSAQASDDLLLEEAT